MVKNTTSNRAPAMKNRRRKLGRVGGTFGGLTLLESGYDKNKDKLANVANATWQAKKQDKASVE